jgi:hypothetical protein
VPSKCLRRSSLHTLPRALQLFIIGPPFPLRAFFSTPWSRA